MKQEKRHWKAELRTEKSWKKKQKIEQSKGENKQNQTKNKEKLSSKNRKQNAIWTSFWICYETSSMLFRPVNKTPKTAEMPSREQAENSFKSKGRFENCQ